MSNQGLAGDITVETAVAFSDALVTAFQICEDIDIPLSSEQKKHIISSSMSVVVDIKDRIHNIIELNNIAREILSEPLEVIIIDEDEND